MRGFCVLKQHEFRAPSAPRIVTGTQVLRTHYVPANTMGNAHLAMNGRLWGLDSFSLGDEGCEDL